MLFNIIRHTPAWVWLVFALVLALGLLQTRTRCISRGRAVLLPVALCLLSLSGVVSSFGVASIALAAWFAGFGAALTGGSSWVAARGAHWCAQDRVFVVPGSWRPFFLIVGLLLCRYAAGASLATNPQLAFSASFCAACGLTSGLFAGLFCARAFSLLSAAPAQVPDRSRDAVEAQ